MATDCKAFSRVFAATAGLSLVVGAALPGPPALAEEPDRDPPPASETTAGLVEETLIARGNELLEAGDFASARLLFQAAANRGSGRAAMLTGVTFDPRYRELAGMAGPQSDARLARRWYALAIRRGDAEARRADLDLVQWLEDRDIDPDAMAETVVGLEPEPPPAPDPEPPPAPDPEPVTEDEPVPEAATVAEAEPEPEPPPPAEASAEPAMEEAAAPDEPSMVAAEADSRVVRALLTSAVRDREPVDRLPPSIRVSDGSVDRIVFFSEVRDLAGQTLSHRWEYQGETMADVSFVIGPGSWRVHSSKRVTPAMTGAWRVVVVDEVGAELASVPFVLE